MSTLSQREKLAFYRTTSALARSVERSPIETEHDAAVGYAEHRFREAVRDFLETAGHPVAAGLLLKTILEEELRP